MRAGTAPPAWTGGASSAAPTRRTSPRCSKPDRPASRPRSRCRGRRRSSQCRRSGPTGACSPPPQRSHNERSSPFNNLDAVKAVILAGGLGSRLSEETTVPPKPMVEIGGKPILWHIMKIYAGHGIEDFVICLGYKGYMIKEWFAHYYLHACDVSFDLAKGDMQVHRSETEPWRVTLVDTGEATMTGGRLQAVLPYVGDEDFCFTYGDGLADVDISATIAFHRDQEALATVTAVQPPGRFGALDVE